LFLHFVSAQELSDYESLVLNNFVDNSLFFDRSSGPFKIDEATITLSWFPRSDLHQEVLSLKTNPVSEFVDDNIVFSFNNPSVNGVSVTVESKIKTNSYFLPIHKKVPFPIETLEPELSEYLKPQEFVDVNEEIRELASKLSNNKDDLFEVVFAFSKWIEENIEYNLTTLTAEANQKSSWVLENGYGVCDEITSLFMSFCKSVGIPVRFVSGVAHTNLEMFENPWGGHGWAEVYFPNFGWIPFDVTYKQLGYLDATHIKFKDSFDSKDSSVDYSARGTGFNLRSGVLESKTEVDSKGDLKEPSISASVEVDESVIGFGSYNLLVLKIRNIKNFYVTDFIQIAPTENVKFFSTTKIPILLKPYETKELYFIIRVDDDLKSGFQYNFPIVAHFYGGEVKSFFEVKESGQLYDFEYFNKKIPSEDDGYSKDLSLDCYADKKSVYVQEQTMITCVLENLGSETLRWVKTCVDDVCYNNHLAPSEKKTLQFNKSFDSVSLKNLVVSCENNKLSKKSYLLISVIDEPKILIKNVLFPETISFKESGHITFDLEKDSFSTPKNLRVIIKHKFFEQSWDVKELSKKITFNLQIRGMDLNLNTNEFEILIYFENDKGLTFQKNEFFQIELNNLQIWEKAYVLMNKFTNFIESLIKNI
ncbi:MAG: transglutaminase-like domain-containing protein, partial [Nanoarchaeota archaeon]